MIWGSKRMSYNVLLSDAVSDYLKSQDRNRQKAILKHLYEMRNEPFKGDVTRLKPPLHRLYRKRIGSDRLLFSIKGRGSLFGADGKSKLHLRASEEA